MVCKSVIQVALHLTGPSFDPQDVTTQIGLSPTQTWRMGDAIGSSSLIRMHDGWVYALPKEDTIEFEHLLLRLLDLLSPHQDRIIAIAQQLNLEMELSCAAYIEDETPVTHLGLDTIRRIAALGADLDIDLIIIN